MPSEILVEIHSWEVHRIFKTKNVSIKDLLVIFVVVVFATKYPTEAT